jgi:hypothetical protein
MTSRLWRKVAALDGSIRLLYVFSMYYATLCAIAKDEDASLVEWADYHVRTGFEHIYVYDNGSVNPVRDILAEFVARGLATVLDFPLTKNQQLSAYAACLHQYGAKTVWMGFLDIDEFVVPKICPDIRNLLDAYLPYGGLAAHWKIFGSGGHKTRPKTGVIRSYTGMIDCNNHIKSLVRPAAVSSVATPHHFRYISGRYCVNEDHVPVIGPYSYHTSQSIQVNHYLFKSLEDFVEKQKRGLATQGKKNGKSRRGKAEWENFTLQASLEGEYDDAILRLLDHPARPQAPLEELKDSFLSDGDADLATFGRAVSESMAARDFHRALVTLKKCLRYHDVPQVWLMAAKLHLAHHDRKAAFPHIVRLLLDMDSPWRDQGFQCLAEYYRASGSPEKAERILAELQKSG